MINSEKSPKSDADNYLQIVLFMEDKEATNEGEAELELILKFEEEEKFPPTEETSSVQELTRMVGDSSEIDIGEDDSDAFKILKEVTAEKEPKAFLSFPTKKGLTGHTLRSHMVNPSGSGLGGAKNEGLVSSTTKSKGFLCNKCNSTFKHKSSLARHTTWSHPSPPDSEEAPPPPPPPPPTTSEASTPSPDARKRKADLPPKGTEQQLKKSKKEGDGEKFEDTEENESMVCYPHNCWPQVKLERLEKLPFLPGGQIQLESQKKNILQERLKQETMASRELREEKKFMLTEMEVIDEQKRCVETAMNDLLEHLEEEKAKKEQMKIEMDQKNSTLENLKIEMNQQTRALEQLKIESKKKIEYMEEELRKADKEKENAVEEKEAILLEVELGKKEMQRSINRLINLDNTVKTMLKKPNKVAIL